MDDQRDYAEEAAVRRDIEREGDEELAAERAQHIDLDDARRSFADYREHQGHAFARGWSCCSAHGPADKVPALIAEIERLNARLDKAHDDLTHIDEGDDDSFTTLESTVEYVVRNHRALVKDFNELWDLTGGLPLPGGAS